MSEHYPTDPVPPFVVTTWDWIDTEDAAELIGVPPVRLKGWRKLRCGPPWHPIGRLIVRYRRTEVAAWLVSSGYTPERRTGETNNQCLIDA